jgi:cell shape-determining protein MreD
MRPAAVVMALGLIALMMQMALGRILAPPWCPDLSWLVVVGVGLRWPGFLSGLCIAALLGHAMDLLSGGLMGQHGLLRIVTYCGAALASRQLDLSGVLSVGLFVFLMTLFQGALTLIMLTVFVGAPSPGLGAIGTSLAHGFVNLMASSVVIRLVERIIARYSDDEVGRRASISLGFDRSGIA